MPVTPWCPDVQCLPGRRPEAWSIARTALPTLAVSIPVNASRRSTGMPSARLEASRSTPAFASAGGKAALVKSGDRGRPVDRGHEGRAVGDARPDVHEAVAEVVTFSDRRPCQ